MKKLHFPIMTAFTVSMILSSSVVYAANINIDWANSITDTNAITPDGLLGKPDGDLAHFSGSPLKFGTISGFGNGDNISYNTNTLASLLNISDVVLEQADLISIEYNGTGGGLYESSHWLFNDGSNSLEVSYTFGDASPAAIVGLGTIDNNAYANYFGFINTRGEIGSFAYILIDIDGISSVNPFSADFSVTLTAGSTVDPATPEPDVIGRINPVPIPGAIWLLGSGLIGLIGVARRKARV